MSSACNDMETPHMNAHAIPFILTHVPVILTLLALLCPTIIRHGPAAQRYLAWLLFLGVGVEGIWAGIFHVFYPEIAARFIGWQTSPFQFEIGVADLAIGGAATISFWRDFSYKSCVVSYITIFYAGVAIGHVHQMLSASNISPGNFGVLLILTVFKVVTLPWLLYLCKARITRSSLSPQTR